MQNTLADEVAEKRAKREKYWKELKIEEKVERSRKITKSLRERVWRLENDLSLLKANFVRHNHVEGKVVKVIEEFDRDFGGVSAEIQKRLGEKDEVYF